ncbi:hypothetical protein [Azotobacter chroococcum]|uniref:hypothetical protein n=1 Tax=Azotobacter chroococcum TaxID=353 RepID=UPI001185F163|nr:hypothetical protein [Azotobacter chroococcum]
MIRTSQGRFQALLKRATHYAGRFTFRYLSSEKEDFSYSDLANIEADFLLNDPLKLNALLQKVGFAINVFKDGLMYVDITDPFKYEGYDRETDRFKLRRTLEGIMLISKSSAFTKAYRQQGLEMMSKDDSSLFMKMRRRQLNYVGSDRRIKDDKYL